MDKVKKYQAECECGWKGHQHTLYASASQEVDQHRNDILYGHHMTIKQMERTTFNDRLQRT